MKGSPRSPQLEKAPAHSNKDPMQREKKKKKFYCLWEKRNGQQTKEKTGQGRVFSLVIVVVFFFKRWMKLRISFVH